MGGMRITNYTQNNQCSNCGECCTAILPMNQQEINRIKHFVKKHGIKEHRHSALIQYDMTCPFRDDSEKKCAIYQVRPDICRKFICNQSVDQIQRNRSEVYRTRHDVFMRSEFFGNNEDKKAIKQLKTMMEEV
jgi:Fe-S-cluster containining protein